MKQGEDFVFDETARQDEAIQEETIGAEDQLPHELMDAEAEILECRSLVVDATKGLHGTKVWIDGHLFYVSGVSFDLALNGITATIRFMPRKLFLRWKDGEGKAHVQAVVDNRLEGRWPQERLAGHASLVFDEVDDAGQPL